MDPEDITKVVNYITEITYIQMGLHIAFKETSYSRHIVEGIVCYSKTNNISGYFSKNNSYSYFIELFIYENIRYDSKIYKRRKCKFCNSKKCNYRLNCCKKPIHLDCGMVNDCNCNCTKAEKINLSEDNILSDTEQKCSICMDECNTYTKCGHCICRACTNELYKNNHEKTTCPICRESIIEIKNDKNKYYDVNIDGKIIKVKTNITFQ